MNEELLLVRRLDSSIQWELATVPSIEGFKLNSALSSSQVIWRNEWCSKLRNLPGIMEYIEERMIKFLCRGPIYTINITRYHTIFFFLLLIENKFN